VPFSIADLGLSGKCRHWLGKQDIVVQDAYYQKASYPWFLKPRMLAEAPFKQACWLDLDCEMVADCSDIFDYAKPGKLGLTVCVDTRLLNHYPPSSYNQMGINEGDSVANPSWTGSNQSAPYWWATGVVLRDGPTELLDRWLERTEKERERGDQEALRGLLDDYPSLHKDIWPLPPAFQWLRKAPRPHPYPRIIHWTGKRGKKFIRLHRFSPTMKANGLPW